MRGIDRRGAPPRAAGGGATGPAAARPRRDAVAGGIMALLGAAAVVEARGFGLGTAARMGPGFYPTAVGAALALVGVLIALAPASGGGEAARAPDWRGWGCILAGVALFAALGERLGLGPAAFACVFVAALGDRRSTVPQSLALAAGAAATAGVVFTLFLKFPLPFVRW